MARKLSPLLAAALRGAGRLRIVIPRGGASDLDRAFDRELRERGLGEPTRRLLLRITPGAAARAGPLRRFLAQVADDGRRLANLDVDPARALEFFDWYAARLQQSEPLARLRVLVALALQQSSGEVSGAEARLFVELAPVEARDPQGLIEEFLRRTGSVIGARRGRWEWLEKTREQAAPPQYVERPKECSWVVPIGAAAQAVFEFRGSRPWLPRELRLVQAAAVWRLAAAERTRLEAESRAHRDEIRTLSERVLEVGEEERRRIGRELHDETEQSILLLRLQLEMLEREFRGHACAGRIREARLTAERAIEEIGRLIAALSPAVLERLGLLEAIRGLAGRLRKGPGNVRVRLSLPKRAPPLAAATQVALYRILQEGCNNILKHARANTVKIHLRFADGFIELTLQDDGRGFNPDAAENPLGTFGLIGMRERAALVGGRVDVRSAPGRGATLHVRLPLEEHRFVQDSNSSG